MSKELLPEVAVAVERLNSIMLAKCLAPALLGHRDGCKGDCDREPTFKGLTTR